MKLRGKVLLMLTVLLVLSLGSMAVVSAYFSINEVRSSAESILKLNSSNINSYISSWFTEKGNLLQSINDTLAKSSVSMEDIKSDNLDVLKSDEDILDIYVVLDDSTTICASGWTPEPGDDLRDREYYTKALENNNIFFSDAYIDSDSKEFIITASRPLVDRYGRNHGIIAMDFQISKISEFIDESVVFDGYGEVFLIDNNSVIISNSNKELLGLNSSEDYEMSNLMENINSGKNLFSSKIDSTEKFIYAEKIQLLNWTIGIGVSEKIIYSGVNNLRRIFVAISIVLFAVSIILTIVLSDKIIINPIKRVSEELIRYSKYDLKLSNEDLSHNSKDEIGQIHEAMMTLRENLSSLIRKIQESSNRLVDLSAILNQTSESVSYSFKDVSMAVEDIARGATNQAEDTERGAQSMSELERVISRNLNITDEVTVFNRKVQVSLDEGQKVLKNLVSSTNESKKVSREVAELIAKTEDSSKKINSASEVIASIAEQTNLLALNAAIEAARAGEAGKGFAVVAEEIRKLAEGSSKSTEEINNVVDELIQNASYSVSKMRDTEIILEKQIENVKETEEKYSDIEIAIENTNQSIDELVDISSNMDRRKKEIMEVIESLAAISEENAASTEETSASTEEQSSQIEKIFNETENLYKIAEELKEEVSKFNI